MRKYNLFYVLIFLISYSTFGQNGEYEVPTFSDPSPGDEIFATPDVLAFQKYNFLPVNLYSGKVNVSIPIFEITSGNINIPISISYKAYIGLIF